MLDTLPTDSHSDDDSSADHPIDAYSRAVVHVAQAVGCQNRRGAGGRGSGFIAHDGLLLTNAHVVAGARELKLTLSDRETTSAIVLGEDGDTDLALLHTRSAQGRRMMVFAGKGLPMFCARSLGAAANYTEWPDLHPRQGRLVAPEGDAHEARIFNMMASNGPPPTLPVDDTESTLPFPRLRSYPRRSGGLSSQ